MRGRELLVPAALAVIFLTGCRNDVRASAIAATGGDPQRGEIAIRRYGCSGCHTVPGVRGANGVVGPSLAGIASRAYLAGSRPNDVDNLLLWIRSPQQIEPGTAMPEMGVTEEDARDIAAYLYTLR